MIPPGEEQRDPVPLPGEREVIRAEDQLVRALVTRSLIMDCRRWHEQHRPLRSLLI